MRIVKGLISSEVSSDNISSNFQSGSGLFFGDNYNAPNWIQKSLND